MKRNKKFYIITAVGLLAIIGVFFFSLMQTKKTEISDPTGTINDHGYVDLGLPSGTKWATCNIGASASSDYGEYFAWGEIETKSSYEKDNSLWYGVSYESLKYQGVIDAKGKLTHQYDVARAKWGGNWRMPTLDEIKELKSKCTWTWTTQGDHNGYKIIGPNGNSIFLPAAEGTSSIIRDGTGGYYWCATFDNSSCCSYALHFYSSNFSSDYIWFHTGCYYGYTVRPVTSGQSNKTSKTTVYENTGDWRVGNYVDKYGDKTDKKYLYITESGECITTHKNRLSAYFTIMEDNGDVHLSVEGLKPERRYTLDYKNERTGEEGSKEINFYNGEALLFGFYNIISSGDKYSFYLWAGGKDRYRFKFNFEGYNAAKNKMWRND